MHDSVFARTWTSASGSTMEGELVSADVRAVVLKKASGSTIQVQLSELSDADREFVASYLEEKSKGVPRIDGLKAVAGKVRQNIRCADKPEWGYHLYLPKNFHTGRKWPVCFVMSAGGGKSSKPMQRYLKGADRIGCVVALSVESKNGFAGSDEAMMAMADDVFARVPVIENLAFSSGMSGGSRMAYLLAETDRRISAVLACGSGSGVYIKADSFRDAKLRKSTYVYSLIGAGDFNRSGAVKSHEAFASSCRLRFFKGYHDWADAALIEQGMARIYGASLEGYRGSDLHVLEGYYVKSVESLISAIKEKAPWEAYYLSSYLETNGWLEGEFVQLHESLESQDKVQLVIQAEKDIRDFTRKYIGSVGFYTEDTKPNPKRAAASEKLASKYSGIPHGEFIRMLGKPSKPPKK